MGLVPLTAPEGLGPSRVVLVSIQQSIAWTTMTLVAQYQRFISATTSPKVLRKPTFWVAQMEYHRSGFRLEFHPYVSILIEPSRDSIANLNTCILCNQRILSSQNAPVSKQVKKGGAVVSNNGVQHSEDMIGKLKPQHTVQPPKGWEEHMFGLRDRRCSLTPHPSIVNTPMLPSPSLHLDNQIHDEDSAMEEMEENPDNNENKDDQPSSNENKDDQPSSSEKADDQLPGSDDDDKGSDYNENENDNKMESSSDSHGFGASLVMQWWAWCPLVFQSLTIPCAQSPLPLSLPPMYKSDDSAHPVGDVVHPCQEGGLIYTRLQKKGKGRAIDAKDIDAANHSDHDTQLLNLKKPGNLSTAVSDKICAFAKDIKMMAEELG
ncbi:hypothetical protein F5J12DRAFT_787271 [Pisolithus orientalis]|uniref:uncharacterized protein n=1 Tax=Pisolithus orientalis TaxID=936130 RepID=UPI0022255A41|nr:uncharacterized protein F5J12DRAFT_787271 [Pisolithus orientalis]KAI5986073.1 hypothetical protein F5J12DRAFT_787271 [Pisolithus orientalis]